MMDHVTEMMMSDAVGVGMLHYVRLVLKSRTAAWTKDL